MIVKVGEFWIFVLDIWEGLNNAGIVPTSAYLGREMRGWSVFCKYWIRILTKENPNMPGFLGMREVRDQKWKRWKTTPTFSKQCLLWNPLDLAPSKPGSKSSSAFPLCPLGWPRVDSASGPFSYFFLPLSMPWFVAFSLLCPSWFLLSFICMSFL